MNLFDHLFAFVIFFVVPLYSWRTYPGWVLDVEARGEPARVRGYKETLLIWFTAAVALAVLWIATGRSWTELGVRVPGGPGFLVGIAICAVIGVLLAGQLRAMAKSTLTQEELRERMGSVDALMPRTKREHRLARLVSLNAGVSEELIFRAYLMWYLTQFTGQTFAAIGTVALFCFAHAYQGWKQLPMIGFIAAVTVVLYIVSGSIWLPILLHVAIDVVQFAAAGRALGQTRDAPVA